MPGWSEVGSTLFIARCVCRALYGSQRGPALLRIEQAPNLFYGLDKHYVSGAIRN